MVTYELRVGYLTALEVLYFDCLGMPFVSVYMAFSESWCMLIIDAANRMPLEHACYSKHIMILCT
jgi:hypothetical protein